MHPALESLINISQISYFQWCSEVTPLCTILLFPSLFGPPQRICIGCSGQIDGSRNWSRLEGTPQRAALLLCLRSLWGSGGGGPQSFQKLPAQVFITLECRLIPQRKRLPVWYFREYPVMIPLGSAGKSQST